MSQGADAPEVRPRSETGDQRLAYDGFFKVVVRRYRMPDGTEVEWDLLDTPASVAVLALTEADQVVLVEQFRPGPGHVVRSLPGGLVDPGEAPADAAARELAEETGYRAARVELVGTIEPLNATRPWHVAIAHDCRRVGAQSLDQFEDIRVVLRDVDAVRADLRTGSIGSLAQIYLALDRLGRL